MMRLTVTLGLCLLLLSTNASAMEYRPYVFVDFAAGFIDLSGREDALKDATAGGTDRSVKTSETSFSYALGAGAQFTRYFSAELAFYDLGSFDAAVAATNADGERIRFSEEIESGGPGLRGIFHIPVSSRLRADVSAGLAHLRTTNRQVIRVDGERVFGDRERTTNTVVNIGLGGSYRLTEAVLLRAHFSHFDGVGDRDTTGKGDIQVLSVGAAYRF